jgi:choloylglycine hydrolase
MPRWGWALTTALLIFFGHLHTAHGCTGIRLIAKDGAVVYGRTMEWGAFDPHSRVAIFPRGHKFTGLTPDGLNGKTWTGTFGFVGLDMINKEYVADGMNEKGLAAGMFYHPGFAEYPEYEPLKAKDSITAFDFVNFVLSQFSTVEEAMAGLITVAVVPVVEEAIGIPSQVTG